MMREDEDVDSAEAADGKTSDGLSPRRRLVDGAGPVKTALVMLYSHLSIALLCLNVGFDLFLFGLPVYLLHSIGLLSNKLYLAITTCIINFTTPIVFTMPMVLSGSKIYCNDVELLAEAKATNSLLLANHGSRIDWMVGMFCGYLNNNVGMFVGFSKKLAGTVCERTRVGFVCEALIQFMPLIGWYRRFVAKDIFVWRSFKQDAPTITQNIGDYHGADERRMLFLSPEGIVVDFGPKDMEYIHECRKFCLDQGYKPFEYVLTPRYKGSMCLLQQVQKSAGPVVSVCLAYVRDGKLLNSGLLSPDRLVPDIYTLNQGVGGSPVDVYIHLKRLPIAQDMNDPKAFMMENYKEKDELLRKWDRQTQAGTAGSKEWMSQFALIENNITECMFYQCAHTVLMVAFALLFDRIHLLMYTFAFLFCVVAGCHTIGWLLNSTSMESVPFETGIKSIALAWQKRASKVKAV